MGLVGAGQDLEFLNRIEAQGDILGAVGSGVDIPNTIDGQLVLVGAGAIHGDAAKPASPRGLQVDGAYHSGNQLYQVKVAAAVYGNVLYLLIHQRIGTLGALELHGSRRRGNLHDLRHLSERHRQLPDREVVIPVDRHFLPLDCLESLAPNNNRIRARRNLGKNKVSQIVSLGGQLNLLFPFRRGHDCARYGRALSIDDIPGQGAGGRLAISDRAGYDQCGENYRSLQRVREVFLHVAKPTSFPSAYGNRIPFFF